MDVLGIIANITGIVSFVPLVIASMKYLTSDRRKRKERIAALKNGGNCRSVALAISFGNTSILTDVEKYIVSNDELKEEFPNLVNAPSKDKISGVFEIHIDERLSDSTKAAIVDIEKLVAKYRHIEASMKNCGVDRIHLFYCGPSIALAPIAAELANRFMVVCYHKDKIKGYYPIGFMQNN